jgi:hypothetical protein
MTRTIPLAPRVARLAPLATSLLAALGACAATPLPVMAQLGPPVRTVLEGYVARSQLHRSVAGSPARLAAVGARLLVPVEQLAAAAPRWLAERVDVGAFLSTAATDARTLAARHYGAQADVRLTSRPLAGRIEPLASLGIGGFRARLEEPRVARPLGAACLAPADPGAAPGARCLALGQPEQAPAVESFALSPALGARLTLVPGVALRVEARDLVVHRDGPRHNLELALGLSFSR